MTVTIEATPTTKMWQDFFSAHYAADKQLKIRFWYSLTALSLGAFGLGGLFDATWAAIALIVWGLYGILSPQIMLVRSLKKLRTVPKAFTPITYVCGPDGLTATNETSRSQLKWSDFIAWMPCKPGILLYKGDGSFLPLPRTGCDPVAWSEFLRLLERSRLPRR